MPGRQSGRRARRPGRADRRRGGRSRPSPLLAPSRPDQAGIVTSDFLRDVYAVLREVNDFVIIDTPPSFTPEVIAAVDSSTEVCLVAMLDSLSLKNTKLGLETLERMDFDTDRIRLVLNRADSNVGIGREDVPAILGAHPDRSPYYRQDGQHTHQSAHELVPQHRG